MALSGLDIYKLLPKTNCKECGFATCLAFAMQLAKKAVSIDKCPYLSEEARRTLEASAQPPIKLVSIGTSENKLQIGNEMVMFRHEEKFYNPCGVGFIIEDRLSSREIKDRVEKISRLKFERVGQQLNINLIAVKQAGAKDKFIDALKLVSANTGIALVLMTKDIQALKEAIALVKSTRPLVYHIDPSSLLEAAKLAQENGLPFVASSDNLEKLSVLTKELSSAGLNELVLGISGKKGISEKIWELTQIRRLALKKSDRSLGYPVITVVESNDPYEEVIEAATYISKYSGIVLLKGIESWQALSILTLRQNIYTDPQKPLQIEPKVYSVGQTTEGSPVLVTTNFSLSYYTVLGEVEASKIPSYIISVDTEGMSVLTAWAAEKFTPGSISQTLNKFGVDKIVSHKKLVIPGYVAVMSGDLEEQSGWQIIVGPKEAAGIPSFLKNLQAA